MFEWKTVNLLWKSTHFNPRSFWAIADFVWTSRAVFLRLKTGNQAWQMRNDCTSLKRTVVHHDQSAFHGAFATARYARSEAKRTTKLGCMSAEAIFDEPCVRIIFRKISGTKILLNKHVRLTRSVLVTTVIWCFFITAMADQQPAGDGFRGLRLNLELTENIVICQCFFFVSMSPMTFDPPLSLPFLLLHIFAPFFSWTWELTSGGFGGRGRGRGRGGDRGRGDRGRGLFLIFPLLLLRGAITIKTHVSCRWTWWTWTWRQGWCLSNSS